jgi:hypothetical protein
MSRNSITAPLHTNMQVQSSVCRKMPFCINCGSQAVLMKIQVFWYIKVSWLVKCYWYVRAACCPHLKVKVSLYRSLRSIGNMMYSSTYSEHHYQTELGGRLYTLAFLTMGTEPQHQLKMRLGASHNQSRHFGKRKLSCYCCECTIPQLSSQWPHHNRLCLHHHGQM